MDDIEVVVSFVIPVVCVVLVFVEIVVNCVEPYTVVDLVLTVVAEALVVLCNAFPVVDDFEVVVPLGIPVVCVVLVFAEVVFDCVGP